MKREEKLARYDALIARCPRFERIGKTMPYTLANGHMFSLFNKAGEIGIRFSKPLFFFETLPSRMAHWPGYLRSDPGRKADPEAVPFNC